VFLKNLEKKIIEFDLGPQIHIQIIFTKYQKHIMLIILLMHIK